MGNHIKESKITKFRFSMGGFTYGTISLELMGNNIAQKDTFGNDIETYSPSQDDWNAFSDSLKKLNVWKWKKNYLDSGVLDGTQWELSIQEGPKKKSCYGSNDYPPDFNEFVSLVNQLVKSDVIVAT